MYNYALFSALISKSVQEQEAIIVGYTAPRGERKQFGSLVLAAYQNGSLTYIGHSGSGFTDKELKALHEKLQKINVKKSPLFQAVPINSSITWVRPKYVCQIKFTEWTPGGNMRHPIFVGMRVDKKPDDVIREVPQRLLKRKRSKSAKIKVSPVEQVPTTHREKVFWPDDGFTKGDLLDYYDQMSDLILPHLVDRPENLNRHPNGITGQSFFQKNTTGTLPDFVRTERIWSDSNNNYMGLRGLVWVIFREFR